MIGIKTSYLWLVFLGGFLCVASAQTAPRLNITVEREQKTEREITQRASAIQRGDVVHVKPQKTEKTQEVVVQIKIQNPSPANLKDLRVKYAIFSKDKKSRAVEQVVDGVENMDINGLQTAIVRTKPAAFESQDTQFAHGDFSEHSSRTGKRYYGIALAVYRGDQKIASYFEPPNLENEASGF